MIRKNKLLIFALFMSMILTVLPGMESKAAETMGEPQTAESELQDENSQRLDEVTATGESGNIYEIAETDGTVEEGNAVEEVEEVQNEGIAMISERSISTKVVNFNTKGNARTNYTSVNGNSGYTNGAYGADAAYLGVTQDGRIKFMLAGVTGMVSASEVELVDYDTVASNVSYYTVSGGKLVHYISQNLKSAPISALNNGPAPSYLVEGGKYYSYDGHYFYADYNVMSADYQAGANGANAVNAGNPFSNYFQFLDMKGSTSYTGEQLNSILNTAMANAWIDPSTSKLTGMGTSFVENQNTYGVNALLSMSIAINESGWGTSWICQNKNNIFGLNAVDSSPGLSADTYASIQDCIRDFMKNWMANGYLSSSDWRCEGSYLGNKDSGINVRYASDPYWGEKAAAHAWNLDAIGGNQDYLGTGGTVEDDTVTDVPATDDTTTDVPATDDTTTDVPSADDTTTDAPETDVPADDTVTDVPSADDTTTDAPETDVPADDTVTDVPSADDTTTDAPATDVPAGDTATDVPATDTPAADDTTTDVPATDTPSADDTTTDIPSADNTVTDVPSADNTVTDVPSADNTVSNVSSDNNSVSNGQTQAVETDKAVSDNIITVSGKLSEGAAVSVTVIEPNTDLYNAYVSANEVKGKTVLGVYDISLTGSFEGTPYLTFNVGTEYNGKNVVILHYTENGKYEKYSATVEDGKVTIQVTGFSPYVIALDETGTSTDTNRSPKTGDSENFAVWAALLGLSAVLATGVVFKRRSYR